MRRLPGGSAPWGAALVLVAVLALWASLSQCDDDARQSSEQVEAEAPPVAEPVVAASTVPGTGDEYRLVREALFAELQPVRLSNCELVRLGEPHDGGYLVCGNLLDDIRAGYSYGIGGYDGWGCDVSRRFDVPVHQYDCFDTRQPACPDGKTVFHAACVAGAFRVEAGWTFDTIARQMRANGDSGSRVVLKIDVEGAEWESFMGAPDDVFQRIDQLVVEFHYVHEERYLHTVRRLKQHFHVAHLHFNNFSCVPDLTPFPAWAYEVLFVNTRIGVADLEGGPVVRPHPLDTPNDPMSADCQA